MNENGPPDQRISDPLYTPKVVRAYQAMKDLTDFERSLVMCWFCAGCWRYVGPGDNCHCMNDE